MKVILFYTLILHSVSSIAAPLIVHGQLATAEMMKSTGVVSIIESYRKKEIRGCTGTRINDDLIVTASHCVDTLDNNVIGVRQALNPLDKKVELEKVTGFRFPIQDYYLRKYFSPGESGDLALIKLAKKSTAPKVEISSILEFNPQTHGLVQMGYGAKSFEDSSPSQPLRILRNGQTDGIITNLDNLTVLNPESSMAGGDSGGPLFSCPLDLKTPCTILAVLSSGTESLSPYGNATYILLSPYLDWMAAEMNHEGSDFISRDQLESSLRLECRSMNKKVGSSWDLDEFGECLPLEEEMCMKLTQGQYKSFGLKWNKSKSRCEAA